MYKRFMCIFGLNLCQIPLVHWYMRSVRALLLRAYVFYIFVGSCSWCVVYRSYIWSWRSRIHTEKNHWSSWVLWCIKFGEATSWTSYKNHCSEIQSNFHELNFSKHILSEDCHMYVHHHFSYLYFFLCVCWLFYTGMQEIEYLWKLINLFVIVLFI